MIKRHYGFYVENKMKGKYKMFSLIPAITICRDTQALKDLGWSMWEFYFEWLWFQMSFQIETEREVKETRYHDDLPDVCVTDVVCNKHGIMGCEICYGVK